MDRLLLDTSKIYMFASNNQSRVIDETPDDSSDEFKIVERQLLNLTLNDEPREVLSTPPRVYPQTQHHIWKSQHEMRTDSSLVESDKLTQNSGPSQYEVNNANQTQMLNSSHSHTKSNSSMQLFDYGPLQANSQEGQIRYNPYYIPQTPQYPEAQFQEPRQCWGSFNFQQQQLTTFQQFHHHQQVRRSRKRLEPQRDTYQFDIQLNRIEKDGRTTLMIKNIPNKYTQPLLLQTINESHIDKYDFFYLPIDFINKCNVGYAFINFVSVQAIDSFVRKYHNRKWDLSNSEKVCQITYARIQGRQKLIAHFSNSLIMNQKDRKVKPVFFIKQLDSIQQLVQRQKESQ